MLVFYILVSVELIAEEIEDPFGVDEPALSVRHDSGQQTKLRAVAESVLVGQAPCTGPCSWHSERCPGAGCMPWMGC